MLYGDSTTFMVINKCNRGRFSIHAYRKPLKYTGVNINKAKFKNVLKKLYSG